MAPRVRIVAFGQAAVLVVAGAICAAVVGGLTGEMLAIALASVGSAERRRKPAGQRHDTQPWPPVRRRPRRPG